LPATEEIQSQPIIISPVDSFNSEEHDFKPDDVSMKLTIPTFDKE
jgi:hypothetical protein